MALRVLGTVTQGGLWALPAWSAAVSAADIAAISARVVPDNVYASIVAGYGAGVTAVLATGATHTNTTLDTLSSTGGAPLSQIQVGDIVCKSDLYPGTYVARVISGTSVQLSQASLQSTSGRVAFVRPQPGGLSHAGRLIIPGRGVLKILPGDVVGLDDIGWPILVSAASIAYAGTNWVNADL